MIIGIDFGATQLRVGTVQDGQMIAVQAALLNKAAPPDSIADQISKLIDPNMVKHIHGIGVGVPGLVDAESGVVYHLLNVPGWDTLPLRQVLEDRYGVPVSLTNDANCFALGVHRYGVAKGIGNVVGLTLGTGLGAGVIAAHELVRGQLSGCGELGLIPYRDGILEQYASGMFFKRNGWPDGQALADRAAARDINALALYEEYGRHLGQAIRIALFAYAPEVIVLGGSVARSYSFFESAMKRELLDFPFPKLAESLQIFVSVDSHMALFGAAALVSGEKGSP